ncbi:uncharacterized protein LOC120550988 isoform X1 [Perca fluviatilis]|uniref:uncharacterized protein LOC120550988 isoform X1 n=1 Tax=Perca fluviatilis TaxID=8168 RepID=UPI001965597A|nr:uncharacterized protein LOC120550988 isoform X1 [Perca fluviatilis]
MSSWKSLGGLNASMDWIGEECLPEITLLDDTCNSTLPNSVSATPVTAGSVKSRFTSRQPSHFSSSPNLNATAQIPCPQNKTLDLLQSNVSSPKADSFDTEPSKHNGTKDVSETSSINHAGTEENYSEVHSPELSRHSGTTEIDIEAPEQWLDVRYFPDITLLDVTRDSEITQDRDLSFMAVTPDIKPVDSLKNNMPPSELSGQIVAEPGKLNTNRSEELSGTLTGNVLHNTSSSSGSDKSVGENIKQTSLDATWDISKGSVLDNSQPSLEPSEPNMVKIQTSAQEVLGTPPANVTHDITSSSDVSVYCAPSQFSTSDMQCTTSSNDVPSELHVEPVVTSNTVEANSEEIFTSHDAELSSKIPQPSPKTAGSVNSTFTSLQLSQLSSSTNLNTTTQILVPQNNTLDLPSSNVNGPEAGSEATDQDTSVSKNVTETSLIMNQNRSAERASGSCDMQNATFDRRSLQKSSGNTVLGDAGVATFCLQNISDTKSTKQNSTITLSEKSVIQNNTFNTKSTKQNGTITLSEKDSHQNTFDQPSPLNVCNATSSPKEKHSEVQPPELSTPNGTIDSTDPIANIVDTPESTFEANPAVEVAFRVGRRETKDHSQSALSLTDDLSLTLGHQSMDTENIKAKPFNWDDPLDLRADSLITSTPMTDCKIANLNIQREEGKTIGAQKKLYGDGPSKPDAQMPSEIPSNIICDRKTFLRQPASKSLLPPPKTASQLLRQKLPSALPGRFKAATSTLPVTRRRTQPEALRNTAASDTAQVTTARSSFYKLCASTKGAKQPNMGLQRLQVSGVPTGCRAATGLRLPSARSNAPASSNTNKLCGPTAANPVTKQPLNGGEALPNAKRKKMDAAVPAITAAEISTSCDGVSRAKALKQPAANHGALQAKPKGHGCANCILLEQQLKTQSVELRSLREELLKKGRKKDNDV